MVLAVVQRARAGTASPASSRARCVALFITFEAPLSGMSMNPARTLGSAVARHALDAPLDLLRRAAARHAARGRGLRLRVARRCASCSAPSSTTTTTDRCIFRCGYPACGPIASAERSRPWLTRTTTTSSSSAPAPAAARSLCVARADRQAHPAPRARRLRAAREGQLELAGRQRRRQVPDARRPGATRTASRSIPHTNYYVGGNTKFYGAALFRLRKEDFGELRHHGGVSPAWPISYDELEPYYTAGRAALPRARRRAARIRPSRRRARPIPHPAVSHEPRIQQLADDFARLGLQPVPRAARHHARREGPRRSAVHPLRHLRRLPLPGRREVRRAGRSASSRRSSTPNVTLLTNAYGHAARDRAPRAAR